MRALLGLQIILGHLLCRPYGEVQPLLLFGPAPLVVLEVDRRQAASVECSRNEVAPQEEVLDFWVASRCWEWDTFRSVQQLAHDTSRRLENLGACTQKYGFSCRQSSNHARRWSRKCTRHEILAIQKDCGVKDFIPFDQTLALVTFHLADPFQN